ncbi:hypothetical protein D5018_16260 [Parashewanella curva]|uniref:Uncharacterized protein n=2 Tax=Parashewanella curva TaxID=2338552 RepID=A0A3L8PUW3_9GAMM|nr:hypothetical protein D5018_16260 [Parashewanella curva]
MFCSYAVTIQPLAPETNFNQIHSGKEFCQIAMKDKPSIQACMPILNFDNNFQISALEKGGSVPITVNTNQSYGFYEAQAMDSITVTISNLQSHKIIYSGKSLNMQGLKCNGSYCVPWE